MEIKLLIVDDERLDREGLLRQLDWEIHAIDEVMIANNGPNAIKILKEKNIDILMTDIKMPVMSGIELARQARSINPEIKIVFISGYDDFEFMKAAIKVSAYEYILKPVQTDELETCITGLINKIFIENERAQPFDNDTKRKNNSSVVINQVIGYIEANYKKNISLNVIAKSMFYTPNYLGSLFKQETGQYFSDFLVGFRIKKAATLLRSKKIKIVEASLSVGYKDMPTFIKNFKSIYGVTPSEYRAGNQD